MTIVVVGVIADRLGAARQTVTVPANHPGRNFDVRNVYMSAPSTEYRSAQPAAIAVDVDHQRPVGTVKYLELTKCGKLYAVSEIDSSTLGDGPWFYSPSILHRDGRDIELRALAVTKSPASVALGPLTAFPGTIAEASYSHITNRDGFAGQLVKRAVEYDRKRRRGEPHEVRGAATPVTAPAPVPAPQMRPAGRIEYRSAQAIDVLPGRTIQVLAVPYGVEAIVRINGRAVAESFANTAFLGEQPKRILATRDHNQTRLFGKVTNLEPFHREGLIATIQAADTPLGRESVELARDGVLDASVGFLIPDPAGERWEGRNRRRVIKALLREISLTPEPAYPTHVISVS